MTNTMTEREELLNIFSDTHKDFFGVRPRSFAHYSNDELRGRIARLETYLWEDAHVDYTPIAGAGWACNAAPLRFSLSEVSCGS